MAKKDPIAKPAFKYLSLAEINKAIDTRLKASALMASDVQELALSSLNHLDQHGDIGPINRLLVGLKGHKAVRAASLSQWFLNFGALKPNDDKETKSEKPYVYDKTRNTDMAGAREMHWTDAVKPRDISDVFDIHAALARIIKQAKKGSNDPALVAALEAIAPVDVQNVVNA